MTRSDERRLIVAFAIAIGIHEVFAGLVPAGLFPKAPAGETVANARIVQIAIEPRTRPTPPPRPVTVRAFATPRPLPAAEHPPAAAGHRGSRHAARSARVAFARTEPDAPPQGTADAPSTSDATGSGPDDGNGAARGSGDGAEGGDEPCGFVSFSDPHGSQFDPHTHGFWVDIRMSVHFADGASQSMILDYPWYYPNEAANPWSDQNLRNPNFLPHFQSPPPQKRDGEPPLVRYVIAHSTADGLTLLQDCPSPPPSPST